MQAISVRDRDAGAGGLSLTDMPYPPRRRKRRHRGGACRGVHPRRAGLAVYVDRPRRVDVVFDVIGGDILDRSTALVRAGGTLVTIGAPPKVRPEDGRAIFFVVEPDRAQLTELAQRLRGGRLKPIIGAVRTLREAPAAFAPDRRTRGKTIIQVTAG